MKFLIASIMMFALASILLIFLKGLAPTDVIGVIVYANLMALFVGLGIIIMLSGIIIGLMRNAGQKFQAKTVNKNYHLIKAGILIVIILSAVVAFKYGSDTGFHLVNIWGP